ncbi:MAG: HYR domain-containing protein [Verrucomicrobia bacterium]|nr:HYR domain-containing protein [Verrucomicrobiota bacterium]
MNPSFKILPILAALPGVGVLLAAGHATAQSTNCIEIVCPENAVVECRDPAGTQVFYSVNATNHCGGALRLTSFPRPGTLFPMGTTTVRWVATDGSTETNECSFTITVRDTTPPEVFCPPEIRVPCRGRTGATVFFRIGATDNCDTNLTVISSPPSGSLFPIGTNLVTCSVTDAAGNRGQCTFPVVVEPGCTVESDCIVMNCPTNIVTDCDTPGGKIVNFTVTAQETCGRLAPTVTSVPPSGSLFPIGETVVICTAVTSVATNQCSFSVFVRDETPPVITCPGPVEVAAQGFDGAIVEFEVSATDDCSTNLLIYCEPPSGSVFPVGLTRVLCFARDEGGNETSCILPITVRPPRPLEASRSNSPPGQLRLRWTHQAILQQTDSLSSPNWQDVEAPIDRNGTERSAEVGTAATQRFFRLIPDPLAPPPDADGDGVPDGQDLCPDTPAGQAVNASGCSPVQIILHPEAVLEKTVMQLKKALVELEREPAFDPARGTLAGLLSFMEGDADFMKRGEVESSADRYSSRVIQLTQVEAELSRLRPQFSRPPLAPGAEADFDEYDERNLFLNYLIRQVAKVREAALVTEAAFNHARDEIEQSITFTGRVAQLTQAGNRAQLQSGEDLYFAEGYGGPDSLSSGADIVAAGVRFKDGSTVVTELQAVNTAEVLTAKKISPLQLKIAPWQLFTPNGPWILHHPLAYRDGNTLYLERGMRFAAGANPVPTPGTLYHALRLQLKYKSTSGAVKQVTLVHSLRVGDKPVELPADMEFGNYATLTVAKLHFPAPGAGQLAARPEVIEVETHTIVVRPRYFFARATYSTTLFDLEDSPISTSYGVSQVTNLQLLQPVAFFDEKSFAAEGYWAAPAATSYPTPKPVSLNTPFAVFAHDFFNPELPELSEHLTGTANPAALRWPRVTGYNNGFAFRYSCELPDLVRDRIAACDQPLQTITICTDDDEVHQCHNNADTYYKLPFVGGYPTWKMSQGNCGCFTHNGDDRFAYDMPAPAGTIIRAARGGRVVLVSDGEWRNCCPGGTADSCMDPCSFEANVVVIEHQDGTVASYVHLPQNGASVAEGDFVRRGDPIGQVGNTGFSTGPHLHFVVRSAIGEPSIPSRFQAWDVVNVGAIRNCYQPANGDLLFSTNKAWYE